MIDSPNAEDAALADARRATTAAAVATLEAANLGTLEDRRMRREFDPTWAALHSQVAALARLLRQSGKGIEDAIADVKAAILAADPTLPPHNALRAAAVGWCVAAYFEGQKREP